jgi:hypothetical protein
LTPEACITKTLTVVINSVLQYARVFYCQSLLNSQQITGKDGAYPSGGSRSPIHNTSIYCNLRMGPISYSVGPYQALTTQCNVTLHLFRPIHRLRRKLTVVNTVPGLSRKYQARVEVITTLAYYSKMLITAIKCFTVQALLKL